jgi:tyrosinase
MDLRKNHRDLSTAEKQKLVHSILALKAADSLMHSGVQSRYDDFVEVHKNAMVGPAMFEPMPHGTPLFYPWHRVLLRQFELALQKVSGDSAITIPYWDWDMTGASNPFTSEFMGGNGDVAQGRRVVDGPFAFSTGAFPVRVWDDAPGDAGLRRELGDDSTSWLPTAAEVNASLAKAPYWGGANSWERTSEGVLHNPVHRWVGGNMADATSPNDPVFFLHHAYLDLLWERWKQQHPSSAPYLPEAQAPSYDLGAALVFAAPNEPKPWGGSRQVRDTLVPSDLGYRYA